ncbi:MAG: tetratricopeptide repeat protein, partial [Candidatus Omnitrophota bacterium]
LREKAASLYDEALSLYKKQRYQEALNKFRQVQRLIPDYGRTERYISRLQDIMKSERKITDADQLKERIDNLYRQAYSYYRDDQLDKATEIFQDILSLDPTHRKARYFLEERIPQKMRKERVRQEYEEPEFPREERISQKEEERRLRDEASSLYDEALSLYQRQRYQEALNKFRQVRRLIPDYGRTEYYMSRIHKDMEGQVKEEKKDRKLRARAAKLYDRALSLYEKGRYHEALKKFRQVQRLIPDYGRTEYYMSRIHKDMEKERRKIEDVVLKEKISALYEQACFYYNTDQLDKAKQTFKEILSLDPAHKKARYFLEKKIPHKIRKAQIRRDREASKRRGQEGFGRDAYQCQLEDRAAVLYHEALSLYYEKQYEEALKKFEEAHALMPGYGRTIYYINRIPQDIAQEKVGSEQARQKRIRRILWEVEKNRN